MVFTQFDGTEITLLIESYLSAYRNRGFSRIGQRTRTAFARPIELSLLSVSLLFYLRTDIHPLVSNVQSPLLLRVRRVRKLDPSPRKNSDYHHSPRRKISSQDRELVESAAAAAAAVKSSSKGERESKTKDERAAEARLKGTDVSPPAAAPAKRSKEERASKEERESRSKEERSESRSAKDEYRSSSKKDRESRSTRRSGGGGGAGDHESRSSSRKEHDSRRRKHRDYKTVYSDSEEEYPHSRSNGNYWKKFYSYA